VLSAYVRGCGGTTEEWEERWRSLTRTPSLPVPAARHVGRSAAAAAGARLNSSGQDGESPNPAIIIAALNRVAEEMAASKSDTPSGSADRPARPAPAAEEAPAVPAPAAPEDRAPAQVTDLPTRSAPAFKAPPPPAAAPAAPPAAASAEQAEPAAEGKPASGWDQLAAGGKPASAWDPIRMSSAWPALRSTSSDTGSSGGASSSASASSSGSAGTSGSAGSSGAATSSGAAGSSGVTGQGTPWGTVPWAEEPARKPAATARATGSAVPANAGSGSPVPSGSTVASGFTGSRTRLIVIAAIALVVLIVLLVIFA
jgi:pilus assembly protein FimV